MSDAFRSVLLGLMKAKEMQFCAFFFCDSNESRETLNILSSGL